MISKDKLSELYNNTLKQKLSGLEKNRKRVKTMQITTFILLFVSIIVLVVFAYPIEHSAHSKIIFGGLFSLLFIGVIFIFIDIRQERKYREHYKKEVFKEVVHSYNPNWKYNYDHAILQDEYIASKLFKRKYNLYQGGDYVEGEIGSARFMSSELKTKYRTMSYEKDGKRLYVWHTIFKGLFLNAKIAGNFKGENFIIPSNDEHFSKKSINKAQNDLNEIEFENMGNKNNLKILSTDEESAREIFTPRILEIIMMFYNKHNKPLYFSFIGSDIYCALGLKKNLFEPRIFKSLLKYNDVELVYHFFELQEEIIGELQHTLR